MEGKGKSRFFEISLLNVLFCMIVIFIHVSSPPISGLDKNSWQYLVVLIPWRLSAFVVQGFIFLSGLKLFLNKSEKINYRKFFKGRFLHIVLPYVAWVFIYYIYFCSHDFFAFNWADFFKYTLTGDLVGHFYFIIIIIQFYILTPLWINLVKRTNSTLLIVFSLVLTVVLGQNLPDIIKLFFRDFNFQYNDRVFTTYLVYWVAGCYAGLFYEKFKKALNNNRIFITLAFLFSSVFDAILSYLAFSGKHSVPYLDSVHLLYCISAICFFYMLALSFREKESSGKFRFSKIIKSIDKVSFGIYLSHCLIIFILDDFLVTSTNLSIGPSYLIRILVVYPVTILSLLLWNYLKTLLQSKIRTNNTVKK